MLKKYRKFPAGIFKSRMKRVVSGYKLIEVFSVRGGSADTVFNVAKVEFGAVVLIEKLMFNIANN